MDNVTPISREEKILAGEEIQPKTRFEYFLKEASKQSGGGGGGSAFDFDIKLTVAEEYGEDYAKWTSDITDAIMSSIIAMGDNGELPELKLTICANGQYFKAFVLSEWYYNNEYQDKKTFEVCFGVYPFHTLLDDQDGISFYTYGLGGGLVSTMGATLKIEQSGNNTPVLSITEWPIG